MTPLERLLAEELPTGTFGDAPGLRQATSSARPATTAAPAPDPNAAAHCAELPNPYARKARTKQPAPRHLRPLPAPASAAA